MMRNVLFKTHQKISSVNTAIDEDVTILPSGSRVSVVSFSATANQIENVNSGSHASWGTSISYSEFPTVGMYEASTGAGIKLYYVCSWNCSIGRWGSASTGEALAVEVPGMGLLFEDGLRLKLACPAVADMKSVITINIGYMV